MKSAAAPPTFEVFDLPGDCRLVLNTNVKMKTVSVLVWFLGNLEEASVTPNSLLPSVLRRGTRSFPDMQAISRHHVHQFQRPPEMILRFSGARLQDTGRKQVFRSLVLYSRS